MTTTSDTKIIFWPTDLPTFIGNENQFLIAGHQISGYKYIVIGLLPVGQLKNYSISENFIIDAALNLSIIGFINYTDNLNLAIANGSSFSSSMLHLYSSKSLKHPYLHSLYNLITYKPPSTKRLEYYSNAPIDIDTMWINSDRDELKLELRDENETEYSKKICEHGKSTSGKELDVEEFKDCLKFMNLNNYSKSKLLPKETKESIWNGYLCFESFTSKLTSYISTLYSVFILKILYFFKLILNYKIHNKSLKTITHTFNQLNFRLVQLCNLPSQYSKMRRANYETEISLITGTKVSPTDYIKFYNTLWLIINDLLLGMILANFIMINMDPIASKIVEVTDRIKWYLIELVSWLMDSPAGFKLNNELSKFFGDLFLWVMKFWNVAILDFIDKEESLKFFLRSLALFSTIFGSSMLFAIVLDVYKFVTFHLHCFYFASTRVFNWQSHVLQSLFRLFYGKKFNPLRKRVDSNDYEFDQLLFGIIIFTILVYLLPTVFAFYVTFVSCRLISITIESVLTFWLIVINHLPAVVILLKVKHQERLPGGITIDINPDDLSFELKTLPLTYSQIFEGHKTSLINYNILNYVEFNNLNDADDSMIRDEIIDKVYNHWRKILIPNVLKDIITGEFITTFDYKKLF